MAGRRVEVVGALGDRAWQHGNIPLGHKGLALRCPAPSIACARGRVAGSFRLKVLITGEEGFLAQACRMRYISYVECFRIWMHYWVFLGGG